MLEAPAGLRPTGGYVLRMDLALDIAIEISRSQREHLAKVDAKLRALQLGEAWREDIHIDRRVCDRAASPCRRADDLEPMKVAA